MSCLGVGMWMGTVAMEMDMDMGMGRTGKKTRMGKEKGSMSVLMKGR